MLVHVDEKTAPDISCAHRSMENWNSNKIQLLSQFPKMISALESTYCEKKKRLKLDLSWNIDADIPLNYFTAKNKSKKLGTQLMAIRALSETFLSV